ncbi:hypothetical protein PYK22_01529 [Pyrinomonas methylaliphatogenes]|uniref:Uncharacterized protein n=1 Tax=Pyrinomonas methylaliphatogenes TaxID=454194 RepID=A0A0B6WWR6_9BACT|nr:hypothetical protein PYK22_01529 [Pyrinomonas methylaliphatogenes]
MIEVKALDLIDNSSNDALYDLLAFRHEVKALDLTDNDLMKHQQARQP